MSQDMFDPELFADFIAEAREHLETIEPNLLELEKSPDNLALLNEIFRPMHSLKGASGFLGLNRINKLAHRSENILDALRKGAMTVTSEIMDVILASTDALRQMIDNLESSSTEGDVATEPIINQIDTIMAGGSTPPSDTPKAATEEIPSPEEPELPQADQQTMPSDTEAVSAENEPVSVVASTPPPSDVAPSEPVAPAKQAMSTKEWIATLPPITPYTLEAFSEEHLKDFIDEASENIENLNSGLLTLEENPEDQKSLVNDIFRYFHNMKGNSGIIGYTELNALTHEAETLLNNVRQDKITPTHELIDLLLLVVDMMESLIQKITIDDSKASPFDTSSVIEKLQQVLAGGPIELPAGLIASQNSEEEQSNEVNAEAENPSTADNFQSVPESAAAQGSAVSEEKAVSPAADSADAVVPVPPVVIPVGTENDDVDAFFIMVKQQMEIINAALATLQKHGTHQDSIDALYRCLVVIRNACSAMGLEEIRVYAKRTADIVDQGRKSGIDFGMMVDMMSQETGIIFDMIKKAVSTGTKPSMQSATSGSESAPAVEPKTTEPAKTDASKASAEPAKQASAAQDRPKPAVPEAAHQQEQGIKAAPAQERPAPPAQAKVAAKPVVTQAEKQAPSTPHAQPPSAPKAPAAPVAKTSAQASSPSDKEHKAASTIRVDQWRLDHLMNSIGELIINRNRYSLIARSLETANENINISEIAQDISETTYAMARISDDLQDTIMKVRMVPVSSVFSRFPRLVRDMSRKTGKDVDLIMEGEETELDKSVVEVIGDPLVHLIRNAVDHGIEPESERIAAGKSPKGKVTLRAFHKGNSVAIEIEDDGQGIDPEKMRKVAVKKGIISQEDAAQLDDNDARELIFAPGFSSAEQITDISGRGVGMDVVRTNIKNLKGSVNTSSVLGQGTKFTLILPLTLAIIDALMVKVAGHMYAIPLDAVAETTKIESERLTDIKGRKAVTLRGDVLGIVQLSEMLGLPVPAELPDELSVVVIHDNERRLGLVVDQLLERQEIVIKPLGTYLGDLQGISGATIMGDGSVILILDPHEIYLLSTSKSSMSNPALEAKPMMKAS